jgi:hypothetical protein
VGGTGRAAPSLHSVGRALAFAPERLKVSHQPPGIADPKIIPGVAECIHMILMAWEDQGQPPNQHGGPAHTARQEKPQHCMAWHAQHGLVWSGTGTTRHAACALHWCDETMCGLLTVACGFVGVVGTVCVQ